MKLKYAHWSLWPMPKEACPENSKHPLLGLSIIIYQFSSLLFTRNFWVPFWKSCKRLFLQCEHFGRHWFRTEWSPACAGYWVLYSNTNIKIPLRTPQVSVHRQLSHVNTKVPARIVGRMAACGRRITCTGSVPAAIHICMRNGNVLAPGSTCSSTMCDTTCHVCQ